MEETRRRSEVRISLEFITGLAMTSKLLCSLSTSDLEIIFFKSKFLFGIPTPHCTGTIF